MLQSILLTSFIIMCILQAVWKLLLSEGEKGVLMLAGSADAQGTYALVSALGALFVRIVLQPFEVRLTHFFAKRANELWNIITDAAL